jgi:hypothetical protein
MDDSGPESNSEWNGIMNLREKEMEIGDHNEGNQLGLNSASASETSEEDTAEIDPK